MKRSVALSLRRGGYAASLAITVAPWFIEQAGARETAGPDWRSHARYDVFVANQGSGDLSVIDKATWKVKELECMCTVPIGVNVMQHGSEFRAFA